MEMIEKHGTQIAFMVTLFQQYHSMVRSLLPEHKYQARSCLPHV